MSRQLGNLEPEILRPEIRAEARKLLTRRWFFRQCGVGLGTMALASLLGRDGLRAASTNSTVSHPLAPRLPHFAPGQSK